MKEKFIQLAENMRKWYSDGQSVIDITGLDPAALKSICGAEDEIRIREMVSKEVIRFSLPCHEVSGISVEDWIILKAT